MSAAYELLENKFYWNDLLLIARSAGAILLRYFNEDSKALFINHKSDNTPVTIADQQASDSIVTALTDLYPDIPCLSEESIGLSAYEYEQLPAYWCIDPLDGTRGFIAGDKSFTVNIALMVGGHPVLGIVYAPALDEIYYGSHNHGAFCQIGSLDPVAICATKIDWNKLRILTGKFHNKQRVAAWLERNPSYKHIPVNSSYKFCLLASGQADLYPRFGSISLWDVAAGSAVLFAAGGSVVDFSAKAMQYSAQEDFLVVPFVALSSCVSESQLLDFISKLGE